jgi:hypothetical protein
MAEKKTVKDNKDAPVELPSAKTLMKQIAEKEADKASEYMRQQTAAEAEKKALIERLSKPSGVSDEEGIRRATLVIQRAAANGLPRFRFSGFRTRFARITAAPSTTRSRVGKTR